MNVNVMKRGKTRRGLKRLVVGWLLVMVGAGVMGLSAWSRGRDWTVFGEGHVRELSASLTSGVVQVQFIDGDGAIPFSHGEPPSAGPWQWRTSFLAVQPEHRWWGWRWFRSVQAKGSNTFAAVPLWVFAVVAVGCGGLLARSGAMARRRGAENRCAGCGYDLRGLGVGAVCPECGRSG